MKRRRKNPSGAGAPSQAASTRPAAGGNPARRWAFRLAAALAVPFLLLGGLEVALRLGDYGHPTTFFLRRAIDGQDMLVENDRFGWRFFPKSVARSPSPTVLALKKAPGTYRIFLFGESAALGDPRPAYGMGRYLETLLRERHPGVEFEVVCVAMTAINSHAILPIARECARHDGDMWIIYMGNNEMEGPFGANTIFGPRAPQLGLIRATLAIRATKIGQLLQDLASRFGTSDAARPTWEGMKMFLEQQLPPDDPRRITVHANFRRNLEDIVRIGLQAGVQPVVCTVASNLKDSPPFASLHGAGLKPGDRSAWETLYGQGKQLAADARFQDAIQSFNAAAALDPGFAELAYRLGQCHWSRTNHSEARVSFIQARDFDALPFRTDTALNEATREIARKFSEQGAVLVDLEAGLPAHSPGGVPGEEFFYDHVHFNFDGNYRIARLIAEKLEPSLPARFRERRTEDWATAEACEMRLGLTDWNRSATYTSMLQRLFDAPFTNQLNHAARTELMVEKIRSFRGRMQPSAVPAARFIHENALSASPRDPKLMEGFAEFLEGTGSLGEAVTQWQGVTKVLPHHHSGYFHLGRLQARLQRFEEARESLAAALRIRPDLVDAHLELAQISIQQKQPQQALRELAEARRLRPDDPRVPFQLGNAEAALGRREAAMAFWREAIKLRPGFWEARYLLGIELAVASRFIDAEREFREVLRLRPDYASAQFNLAVALAKQGRIDAAVAAFQETLRLDPKHPQAWQYLQALQPTARTPE